MPCTNSHKFDQTSCEQTPAANDSGVSEPRAEAGVLMAGVAAAKARMAKATPMNGLNVEARARPPMKGETNDQSAPGGSLQFHGGQEAHAVHATPK